MDMKRIVARVLSLQPKYVGSITYRSWQLQIVHLASVLESNTALPILLNLRVRMAYFWAAGIASRSRHSSKSSTNLDEVFLTSTVAQACAMLGTNDHPAIEVAVSHRERRDL